MKNEGINILIGGEAGQGLVTIGQILAKIFIRSGYSALATQSYQSRIRGGHNSFSLRVSSKPIVAPAEKVNLLVALNTETIEIHQSELSSPCAIIADEAFQFSQSHGSDCLIKVPFSKLAPKKQINISALGILTSVLGIDRQIALEAIEDFFEKKDTELQKANQAAFEKSLNWASMIPSEFGSFPRREGVEEKLMLNGNEALALGAVASGLKFYSFYPMTPSTGIGQTLASISSRLGIVVEQGEDEIAVINMAIGASFAGAPAMVGTSGGGFALMVEGVSLAGMTETPIVVVIGQRPAPATGLPTRTEQADMEFVLHAGHGEFPRAIFAPGTVEDCFHFAGRALHLAEKYQIPVFILTDQYLADSACAVRPFDLERVAPVVPGAEPASVHKPYLRYALTDTGVSPRLLPGLTENLVVADSDEHTEDGHLTEDLSVRKLMVEKRLRKLKGLRQEVVAPEFIGDIEPEILLVCWGSTKGSALEACEDLRANGKKSAVLHFSQLWPLVPEQFIKIFEKAKEKICIESNAFGQLARLIRGETGFEIKKQIHRYDGLPITPEFILRELRKIVL